MSNLAERVQELLTGRIVRRVSYSSRHNCPIGKNAYLISQVSINSNCFSLYNLTRGQILKWKPLTHLSDYREISEEDLTPQERANYIPQLKARPTI